MHPRKRPMTLDQFKAWLDQWREDWGKLPECMKTEKTLEDWLGSLDAYAVLQLIATSRAKR